MRLFSSKTISILFTLFVCVVLNFSIYQYAHGQASQSAIDGQVIGNQPVTGGESQAAIDARVTGQAGSVASQAGTRAPAPTQAPPPLNSNSLSGLLIGIAGVFLWIGMRLFDASLNLFVTGTGALLNGSLKASIDEIWIIVRDLVNLTFIFGLVYAGFRTILDADMSGTKRMLAQIIIGALLVNFSLFITKVVIDVSNVTAVQIYNAMNLQSNGQNLSISGAFMAQMGLVQLVNIPTVRGELITKTSGVNPDGEAFLPFIIGATIFILVAAFVFAAGALLLAIRFGVLLILMMLSPIAFAAQVFPKIAAWSKTWWDKLFQQAFFAPAYLFMLYLTLRVATGYQDKMSKFDGIFSSNEQIFRSGFDTAAYFTLTTILLVASLIVAKQMGAYGAGKALSFGNWMRRQTTSSIGRNTLGRFADWRSQKREEAGKSSTSTMSRIYSSMAKSNYGGSLSRPQIREAGEKAARVRARNAQVAGISDAISVGAASAPGSDQRISMERAIAGASNEQLLDMIKGKKPGDAQYDAIVRNMSAGQFDSMMKSKPEDLDDTAKATLAETRSKYIRDRIEAPAHSAAPVGTTLSPQQALGQEINKASAADLKAMGAGVITTHAADLKHSQFEDLMKSSDYTETEKARIRKAREDGLKDRFNAAVANSSTGLFFEKLKDTERANLPKDVLLHEEATPYLTPGVLAKMTDGLTKNEREVIRNRILDMDGVQTNSQSTNIPYKHPAYDWINSPRGAEF